MPWVRSPEGQRELVHWLPPGHPTPHGPRPPPPPRALTCISSVMATKSATEMQGPVRKSSSFRNLSSSSCRHLSSSASVDANVSGGTRSPRNTGSIIWWGGRQERAEVSPKAQPSFSLLLPVPFHPQPPPPAQASSPPHTGPASTLPRCSQGRWESPLKSQAARPFSLQQAFRGSHCPPTEASPPAPLVQLPPAPPPSTSCPTQTSHRGMRLGLALEYGSRAHS